MEGNDSVSASIFLDEPFELKGSMAECRKAFFELAKSRTFFVTREEFENFQKQLYGGAPEGYDAAFGLARTFEIDRASVSGERAEGSCRKFIDILISVVNTDYFALGGVPCPKAACYAAYHEAWESWLDTKRGRVLNKKEDMFLRHFLARRKEVECALAQGDFEELYAFVLQKDAELAKQYAEARDALLRRKRGSRRA